VICGWSYEAIGKLVAEIVLSLAGACSLDELSV
jgi:hypothetical protein